jgi:hypothetical protein
MRLDKIETSDVIANRKHLMIGNDTANDLSNGEMSMRILRAVVLVMPGHGTSTSRRRAIGFELQVNYPRR